MKLKRLGMLALLTAGALVVHGYHPYAEDAEIYVPGIVKILHPNFYPFGQEFFESHAHMTLFPNLVAWTARLTHLPLEWALFAWHVASIFLLLFACLRIAEKCFETPQGRWGAVAMVAALLTLPVAGTALYILDQYFNPRSVSAFAVMFAIDAAMEKKYWRAALWLIFTAVIHPLMAVFGIAFAVLLVMMQTHPAPKLSAAILFPGLFFSTPSAAYWQALHDHDYYFLLRWQWYEWLGLVAPIAILWWFCGIAKRRRHAQFERLCRTTVLFGVIFLIGSAIVTIPKRFEILDLYQPMRFLLIIYIFLALFSGGLLGEWALKNRPLRWLALYAPLCAGMCYAQFQLFPTDRHIEWPGAGPTNPWMQAFVWIRENTKTNAIFALDPEFTARPGEDNQGFRASAERSRLADSEKDWSASAMFPNLPFADDVQAQVHALKGWENFGTADFERLNRTYGVTWAVVEQPGGAGLDCPYHNKAVSVCRVK